MLSAWKPEESLFTQLLQGWSEAPPNPRHGGPKLLLDEQLRGTETSLLMVSDVLGEHFRNLWIDKFSAGLRMGTCLYSSKTPLV